MIFSFNVVLFFRVPDVILVHFVQGLPDSTTWSQLDFKQNGDIYVVTGVIQFKMKPDHFVAWLRDTKCK